MEFDKELLKRITGDTDITSRAIISQKYGVSDRAASYYWFIVQNMQGLGELFETDKELVEQNVKYQKQRQKYMDFNRVERKAFREHARIENAVDEHVKELTDVISKNSYSVSFKEHKSSNKATGVFHLTDTHFNELIDMHSNKYDFTIASKRIYKMVTEAIKYFKLHEVTDVFLLLSGDTVNSDRRLDELVSQATNRSKAVFIAVQIIENAIFHLNDCFNVHIAGVCGNESRVGKDINWANEIVSDNYDFTIFNILRYKLKDEKGISFLGMSDKYEEVVKVGNKNILVIHGHQLGKDMSKDISKLIRKWAQRDVVVNFIVFGHIHEAMIADNYARGSSLCGSNNYSEDNLLLVGRASQNIHVVFDDDRIDSVKIDLQDTEGYEGYDTFDWQDAYNPKSLAKSRHKETILTIQI